MLAAKEKTASLDVPFAEPKTRVWGLPPGNRNSIGGCSPVTSTHVWGCWHTYAGTASGELVNRYYSNAYGRFMTPDQYLPSGKTTAPQSWNRYAYAGGDPVNRIDPSGTDYTDPLSGSSGFGPGYCDPSQGPGYCDNTCVAPDGITPNPTPGCQDGGPPTLLPPDTPIPKNPTCGQVLNLSAGNVKSTDWDLLGVTSFFEDEAAGNPSSTILSIWTGIDWTFENRASLTPTQAAAFYGAKNVPTSLQSIVTGPTGSQVWGNGTLKSNFSTQLNNILNGSATSSLCTGLSTSIGVAIGVTTGYTKNNVPGALQFASGGVVPGHGPGVTENPVATFGNFTFYQPIYPQ